MYWRRFRISDIPVDNEAAFAMWLKNRWTEKDYLLEHFARHGAYPESDPVKAMKTEAALRKLANANGNGDKKQIIKPVVKTAKFITTEVKAGGIEEFMSIFAPITAAATALSSGNLSPENIDFDALLSKVAQQQQMNLLATGAAPKTGRNQEAMRQALIQATKALATGKPVNGSALEKIIGNAPQQQREMFNAMTKGILPQVNSPTAGKRLDPAISNTIESAHEATRQRLSRASRPGLQGTKAASSVRKSIPMTPMETIVTRPISTIAMQRATQHMQRAAAGKKAQSSPAAKKAVAPVKKQVPSKPSTATANGTKDEKKQVPPKLAVDKKEPPKVAGKPTVKAPVAPKKPLNGTPVKAKK